MILHWVFTMPKWKTTSVCVPRKRKWHLLAFARKEMCSFIRISPHLRIAWFWSLKEGWSEWRGWLGNFWGVPREAHSWWALHNKKIWSWLCRFRICRFLLIPENDPYFTQKWSINQKPVYQFTMKKCFLFIDQSVLLILVWYPVFICIKNWLTKLVIKRCFGEYSTRAETSGLSWDIGIFYPSQR